MSLATQHDLRTQQLRSVILDKVCKLLVDNGVTFKELSEYMVERYTDQTTQLQNVRGQAKRKGIAKNAVNHRWSKYRGTIESFVAERERVRELGQGLQLPDTTIPETNTEVSQPRRSSPRRPVEDTLLETLEALEG